MYICIFFSFLHLFYGPVHPAVYLLHVICSVSVLLLCFITAQFSHLCGSFGSESMLCNCNIICLVLVLNFPEHSRLCVCVCVCVYLNLTTYGRFFKFYFNTCTVRLFIILCNAQEMHNYRASTTNASTHRLYIQPTYRRTS